MQPRQLQHWEEHGSCIDVNAHGMTETRRGFEVELMRPLDELPSTAVSSPETESNLSRETIPGDILLRRENLPDLSGATHANEQTVKPLSYEDDKVATETSLGHIPEPDTTTNRNVNPERVNPSDQDEEVKAWSVEAGHSTGVEQEGKRSLRDANLEEEGGIIYNLIVSVKAPQTVKAIRTIAHRLTHESTILFLQNGMGIIDEVNEQLFPDDDYRPTYIIGVVTHGLYSNGSFSVVHSGDGTIALGALPRRQLKEPMEPENLSELAHSARYLIRTMTRTPVFVAIGFPPTDLLQQQLDKLAVNCVINPLTTIMDSKNGALLSNMYLTRVIRLLLAEISAVIKAMPELKNVSNVSMRFDSLRLERIVFSIANKTAENHSSMLQDVRMGRQTEIDYITGYIVRRGEEMGIHCVMNYMLMHMIKAKTKIKRLEQAELLPLVGGREGR